MLLRLGTRFPAVTCMRRPSFFALLLLSSELLRGSSSLLLLRLTSRRLGILSLFRISLVIWMRSAVLSSLSMRPIPMLLFPFLSPSAMKKYLSPSVVPNSELSLLVGELDLVSPDEYFWDLRAQYDAVVSRGFDSFCHLDWYECWSALNVAPVQLELFES